MKHPGPELGNLSSRFFAYTQLKKMEIIRTGELVPVLGITESQERDLLRRMSNSGWIVRIKRGVYLVPPRLPAGGKYSPGVASDWTRCRTHRISVVIAAMLRFALEKLYREGEDGTLCRALVALDEEPYLAVGESEEYERLLELIDAICREAGLRNLRESARGGSYSIAENAIAEYASWYNMPWEDH